MRTAAVRTACVYKTAGCEIDFSSLSANFGIASPNQYGAYPRTWNLEQVLKSSTNCCHASRSPAAGSTARSNNLTRTINQSRLYTVTIRTKGELHADDGLQYRDRRPDHRVCARTAAAQALPTKNLDTADPRSQACLQRHNLGSAPGSGRVRRSSAALRSSVSSIRTCAAADNPNTLLFCDDTKNDVPFSVQFKAGRQLPAAFGLQPSGSFQSNQSPAGTPGTITSTKCMASRAVPRATRQLPGRLCGGWPVRSSCRRPSSRRP